MFEMTSNSRHGDIRDHAEKIAFQRNSWIDRNKYFHKSDWDYLRLIVPEAARVLEVGCGTGQLLNALEPKFGVGIDLSNLWWSAPKKPIQK